MVYKPMPTPAAFKKYLKCVGWTIEKGGFDWNVVDGEGRFICSVIITHGNTKSEVCAHSSKKIEREFKQRGWSWPPKKKEKS